METTPLNTRLVSFFQTCFDECVVSIRDEMGICCQGLPMVINMSYSHVFLAHKLVVCPVYLASVFFMDSQDELDRFRNAYWKKTPEEWIAERGAPLATSCRKRYRVFRAVAVW